MKKQLAFVLSGGGSRGALQVGALWALLEANLHPDLLVGTSAGAINAALIALHGLNRQSLENLVWVYQEAGQANLLSGNSLWLAMRALLGRPSPDPAQHIRQFLIAHGITPSLRFSDIQQVRLVIVSSDLNTGHAVLHGQNSADSILEALMASTAIPPWVTPIQKDRLLLMDGGTVSNLPIEPALSAGATEIIALDLTDPRDVEGQAVGFGPFIDRLIYTIEQRQQSLELALAAERSVPVTHIHLHGVEPVSIFDFSQTAELIAQGYSITRQALEKESSRLPALRSPSWTPAWLRGWWQGNNNNIGVR